MCPFVEIARGGGIEIGDVPVGNGEPQDHGQDTFMHGGGVKSAVDPVPVPVPLQDQRPAVVDQQGEAVHGFRILRRCLEHLPPRLRRFRHVQDALPAHHRNLGPPPVDGRRVQPLQGRGIALPEHRVRPVHEHTEPQHDQRTHPPNPGPDGCFPQRVCDCFLHGPHDRVGQRGKQPVHRPMPLPVGR